jgi:hypothetical protein
VRVERPRRCFVCHADTRCSPQAARATAGCASPFDTASPLGASLTSAMKALLAIVIAVLSTIESLLIALLFIVLLDPPAGGGEFSGMNTLGDWFLTLMYLPPVVFLVVLLLVLKYYRPENHRAFRNFAWALAASLGIAVLGMVFAHDHAAAQWSIGISVIVLALLSAVILWQARTRDADDSFQTGA